MYKNTSNYSINFISNFQDITSLELVNFHVPDNVYTISDNCNKLSFSISSTKTVKSFNIDNKVTYVENCDNCNKELKIKDKTFNAKCKNIEFDNLPESEIINIRIPKGFYDREHLLPIKITVDYGGDSEYQFYKHWDFLAYSIQQEIFNHSDLNGRDVSKNVLLFFYDIVEKKYDFFMFKNKTKSFVDSNKEGDFKMFLVNNISIGKTTLNSFYLMEENNTKLEFKITLGKTSDMLRMYYSKGLQPFGEQSIEKIPTYYPDGSIKRYIHKELRNGTIVEIQGDIIYEEKKVGETDYSYLDNSIGAILGFNKKNLNGNIKIKASVEGNSYLNIIDNNHDIKVNDFIELVDYNIGDSDWNIEKQMYIVTGINSETKKIDVIPSIKKADCYYIQKYTYHSEFTSNLDYNKNIILNIDNIEAIKSNNTQFNKSYSLFTGDKSMNSLINSSNNGLLGTLYSFNPPMSIFNKLNITFTDVNGNLYDFGGLDNTLIFSIGKLNSVKYIK